MPTLDEDGGWTAVWEADAEQSWREPAAPREEDA